MVRFDGRAFGYQMLGAAIGVLLIYGVASVAHNQLKEAKVLKAAPVVEAPPVLLSAAESYKISKSAHDAKVAKEIPLMLVKVIKEIHDSTIAGRTDAFIILNDYEEETIKLVTKQLKSVGYAVEISNSKWTHDHLLSVSWSWIAS